MNHKKWNYNGEPMGRAEDRVGLSGPWESMRKYGDMRTWMGKSIV